MQDKKITISISAVVAGVISLICATFHTNGVLP